MAEAFTMLVVGAPGNQGVWRPQNIALVGGGSAVLLGSLGLLLGPASAPDTVRVGP